MKLILTLFALAAFATAAEKSAKVYEIPEGDRLELNMGSHVKEWTRARKNLETTKYCNPQEKLVDATCGKWVDSKTGHTIPGMKIEVTRDGTLIFEKITLADSGDYATPEPGSKPGSKPVFTPRTLQGIKVIKRAEWEDK